MNPRCKRGRDRIPGYKKGKSGFIVPLNQTDEGIPQLIFQFSFILLIATAVLLVIGSVIQIAAL